MVSNIFSVVEPVIRSVKKEGLQKALSESFESANSALQQVQQTFDYFASKECPVNLTRCFMKSWHSTHLKMLPIYGLSCRLQKRGFQANDENIRNYYFLAAAHNAETSYEDLSIDMPEWSTHSELFDEMANTLCDGDEWKLDRYCLPEAKDFQNWIYHNMVMDDLEIGLLTNMFSEIYNHGEYSLALEPFRKLMHEIHNLETKDTNKLLTYIQCHVESNVEEAHFNCVVHALDYYSQATGRETDYPKARKLFEEYLSRSGQVMTALEVKLECEG